MRAKNVKAVLTVKTGAAAAIVLLEGMQGGHPEGHNRSWTDGLASVAKWPDVQNQAKQTLLTVTLESLTTAHEGVQQPVLKFHGICHTFKLSDSLGQWSFAETRLKRCGITMVEIDIMKKFTGP